MAEENPQSVGNKAKEDTFDITGLLLAYLANWKWFVISVVVLLIGTYFFIARMTPLYQVNASIFLDAEKKSTANTFSMSSNSMVDLKSFIDKTEIEILKSQNNVIKIVDSLGLAYSYAKKGTFRDIPLYQNNAVSAKMDSTVLRSLSAPITIEVSKSSDDTYDLKAKTYFNGVKEEKKLDDVELPCTIELSQGTVEVTASPVRDLKGTEIITIKNPRWAAAGVSASLNISFALDSKKILRIVCTTDNIKRGIDIINALLDFYNQDIIADKNRSAIQTEAFILDRLVMISGELKDVENRLQEYRQTHNITDIKTQAGMNLSLQSNYVQQIADVETQLSILDEIEAIVSHADTYETLPAAVNNSVVAAAIDSYNRRVGQLNRSLEGLTPDNPLILTMQDELSRDKVRILQNLGSARRNLEAQRNTIRTLEGRSTGQLAATPSLDKGLQEIFREQQVKVNIYTFLLQRREEIALQKTLATSTARLIDNPSGTGPVSPKKLKFYGLAFLIGLLLPAGLIFLRRMLFPVFNDQEDLERMTSVPILGEICQTEKGQADGDDIVVGENVSTPIAELFRLLRNNISFTRKGVDSKVILVTSAVSGEGKTFVATNLAMTYALMGKKTLVIGMDLRRPMLAHRFGLNNAAGVTTYLSGQEPNLSKLITQSKFNDNLFVLPAGPVPPNPNELLMSSNMTMLIDTARKDFDYVIIDSAPIGIISDSYLIMRHTDLQIYVTRANYSTKNSLKLLHNGVASDKFSSVYIVLNGVNTTSNSYVYRRYGEYGRYGRKANRAYGYGYGYGYTNDGNKHKKHHSSSTAKK